MKSLHRGSIAGNAKLKGKKTLNLSCGCCTVENFKEECRNKEALLEIANWMDEGEYETASLEEALEFARKRNES